MRTSTVIEVEIDESGHVRPVDHGEGIPAGRALLSRHTTHEAREALLMLAHSSLAEDWLGPEEDEAWAHLQKDYSPSGK